MKVVIKRMILFAFSALASLVIYAQDIYTSFQLQEYPVEFRHLQDYRVNRVGNMSYIITNGVTEFYLKGYNLSNRFNADSLQRLFEKDLYNDKDIVNLQMREKGRGALGAHAADRLVLEFYSGERLYKVIAFMVYFHINHEYNSLLFFFDMDSKSSISYEDVLINMGQTVKWAENIPFKTAQDEGTEMRFEMPVFWRVNAISEGDRKGFLIDDGKARIRYQIMPAADSSGAPVSALKERDALKVNPGTFKESKFKAGKTKLPAKETGGLLTGTYKEDVNGLLRPTLFNRDYYQRIMEGKLVEIQITAESPSADAAHYAPLQKRVLDSFAIPGTIYLPPKKKKK
jgi:hypothetical protein